MKKLLKALALISLIVSASANAASAPIFQAGEFEVTGTVFVDISDETNNRGIGQFDSIRHNGQVIWESGDDGNYVNFEFSGYAPTSATPLDNGVTAFTAESGSVNFWLNSSAADFQPNNNYRTAVDAMSAGELFISAIASGPTSGQFSETTYSANGNLDVTGGSIGDSLDTNSVTNLAGILADMTFNVSADNIHGDGINAEYNYSGSNDLNGLVEDVVSEVPVPAAIWLMGSGIAGLFLARKRKPSSSIPA